MDDEVGVEGVEFGRAGVGAVLAIGPIEIGFGAKQEEEGLANHLRRESLAADGAFGGIGGGNKADDVDCVARFSRAVDGGCDLEVIGLELRGITGVRAGWAGCDGGDGLGVVNGGQLGDDDQS